MGLGICSGLIEACIYDEYATIKDKWKNVEEFTESLSKAGVTDSNLIIGIDYTSTNKEKGKETFGGKSLHAVEEGTLNPYQKCIQIIGRTLSKFDEDGIIPVFGFGDEKTKDQSVFPVIPEGQDPENPKYCVGFEEVLKEYSRVTPTLTLSGPQSYKSLIEKSIATCMETNESKYHILLILSNGQVEKEQETIEAIKKAQGYPLSIVFIGIGDGPWDQMEFFDDKLEGFDNFQFIEYRGICEKAKKKGVDEDLAFAVMTLMEVPDQFAYFKATGLIGKPIENGKFKEEPKK